MGFDRVVSVDELRTDAARASASISLAAYRKRDDLVWMQGVSPPGLRTDCAVCHGDGWAFGCPCCGLTA